MNLTIKTRATLLVDIDNTLADTAHRAHYVNRPIKEKDWPAFFKAMGEDTPIIPVINKVKEYNNRGWNIILITGRPDKYEHLTLPWLEQHNIPFCKLIMKKKGEYRARGSHWKAKIYGDLIEEGWKVKLAIDDEEEVREVYKMIGLECFNPINIVKDSKG